MLDTTTTNVRFGDIFFFFGSMTKISLLIINLTLQKKDFVTKYFTIKFSLQNNFLSIKLTTRELVEKN